jgi:hypothetical protein
VLPGQRCAVAAVTGWLLETQLTISFSDAFLARIETDSDMSVVTTEPVFAASGSTARGAGVRGGNAHTPFVLRGRRRFEHQAFSLAPSSRHRN